jgi:CRP-like cAMP-binding protein
MSDYSYPSFQNTEHLGKAIEFAGDIFEVVKVLPEFDNFTAPEYAQLCNHMECFGTATGATIITENTTGSFLIIILTGLVDVVKMDSATGSKTVSEVGPGGVLGEMSLMDGQPRFASCITRKPTDFAVLTRQALGDILDTNPKLGQKLLLMLLQLMTSRLRDATVRMMPTISSQLL